MPYCRRLEKSKPRFINRGRSTFSRFLGWIKQVRSEASVYKFKAPVYKFKAQVRRRRLW